MTDQTPPETPDDMSAEEEAQETLPEDEAKPPDPKKWKLKVDGKEEEADEPTVLKWAQIGRAKERRFEDAARERQAAAKQRAEAEQLLELMKSRPRDVFKQLGLDPRKVSEDLLYELLQEETLTPDQRELREARQKLATIEEEKKATERKAQDEQLEKLTAAEADRMNRELPKLMSAAGLPRSPRSIALVAQLWLQNDAQGYDLPLDSLVEIARDQYLAEIRELFGAADGDTVLKLLGEDVSKKVRKADLARLKAGSIPAKAKPEPTKTKPMTRDEYLAHIERLKAGG